MLGIDRNPTTSFRLLQAKASRHAIIGVLISVTALVAAILLSSRFQYGEVCLAGIIKVERHNMVLWFMDAMPFLFAIWGQLGGAMVTREAGTMMMDQTQKFMDHTQRMQSQAAHAATHDSLTGLPNRVLFREKLDQALAEARGDAQGKGLALMLFDLDHFKDINDTLGHQNGDLILQRLATRLDREIEVDDILARMGGDEFALLLPEIGRERDVRQLAVRLLEAVSRPLQYAGLNLDLRMSIGIAVFPEHGLDVDTLLMRADIAMYAAKEEGGGYREYAPAIDRYSPERLILMGELRKAIGAGELFVEYQPKVANRSKMITDAEALLRWAHPSQGVLPPGLFIPMAERTGLIKELSLWVLEAVIAQIAAWQKVGKSARISVNLSARDLLDPELPKKLGAMLHRHGVAPEQLVVEITETMFIVDPERALAILHRIAAMGVGISLDDFGTGYSSLAYLRKIPAGEIKIDRSFVMDMLNNNNDAMIVQAAISLAHSLGLKVVAEGVETAEIATRLSQLGCDIMQGFHFSRPMAAEDFFALISSDLSDLVH